MEPRPGQRRPVPRLHHAAFLGQPSATPDDMNILVSTAAPVPAILPHKAALAPNYIAIETRLYMEVPTCQVFVFADTPAAQVVDCRCAHVALSTSSTASGFLKRLECRRRSGPLRQRRTQWPGCRGSTTTAATYSVGQHCRYEPKEGEHRPRGQRPCAANICQEVPRRRCARG